MNLLTFFRTLILLIFTIQLTGCNGGSNNFATNCSSEFSTSDATTNKSQQLYFIPDGKCISNGRQSKSVKDVPFELSSVLEGFEVGNTARIQGDNGGAWIEVTNNTGQLYCSVGLQSLSYLDESGTELYAESYPDLIGHLYDAGSYTRYDCLEDGDSGFIEAYGSYSTALAENTAKLTANELSAYTFTVTPVQNIEAGTMTWNGSSIRFELTNTSNNTLNLETLPAQAMYYDANYKPLESAYLNIEGTDLIISPGQSFILSSIIAPSDPAYSVELMFTYDLAL